MTTKSTSELVKELRERTGVGMGKCKDALDKARGNMDKAIEILRKEGLASAVKKEGRAATEGLIGCGESKDAISMVEVNSETDFVAQNEQFKEFVAEVAHVAATKKSPSLEKLLQEPSQKDTSLTLDQRRSLVVQKLGENIRVKRVHIIPKSADHSIGTYMHMGGKIVAAVVLAGAAGQEAFAREIAMHTAAADPLYLKEIPSEVRAKEEEIARSQVVGKPPEIAAKIVQNKVQLFCSEMCLLYQPFIKDPKVTIAQLIEQESKRLGKPLVVEAFYRWKVEG